MYVEPAGDDRRPSTLRDEGPSRSNHGRSTRQQFAADGPDPTTTQAGLAKP